MPKKSAALSPEALFDAVSGPLNQAKPAVAENTLCYLLATVCHKRRPGQPLDAVKAEAQAMLGAALDDVAKRSVEQN